MIARAVLAALALAANLADAGEGVRASCDSERRTVRIEGDGLAGPAMRPVVFLNGHAEPLEVPEWNARAIVARLPRDLGDGLYVLRVRHAADAPVREVPLVLGIVGPATDD